MEEHDIGWAVRELNCGRFVGREAWNTKEVWLGLQKPDENSANTLPYVYMITVDGKRVPWLCSQSDLLAWDWEVVEK